MNELWLTTASLDDLIQILLWLLYELLNAMLIGEDAVLLCVLKHSEIWLSWHQETMMLHYVDKTEAKEV